MDFFAGFCVDVNMLGRRLTFYRTAGLCASPHVLMAQPLYAVPEILPPPENRPIVTANVGGQLMRAALDPGSPQSFLFRHGAARLGLSLGMHAPDAHTTVTGIGPRSVDVV